MCDHITSLHSFVESAVNHDILNDSVFALIHVLGIQGNPGVGFGFGTDGSFDLPAGSEEGKRDVGTYVTVNLYIVRACNLLQKRRNAHPVTPVTRTVPLLPGMLALEREGERIRKLNGLQTAIAYGPVVGCLIPDQ